MSSSSYRSDRLSINADTNPSDIREFVEKRVNEPITVDGVTIYSFNSHKLDREELQKQVDSFAADEYVVPYQIPGVWAYMFTLLPEKFKNMEYLVYNATKLRYKPVKNYYRVSSTVVDDMFREEVRDND